MTEKLTDAQRRAAILLREDLASKRDDYFWLAGNLDTSNATSAIELARQANSESMLLFFQLHPQLKGLFNIVYPQGVKAAEEYQLLT